MNREHLLQDLSPYICVIPRCPQSHCVYGTQRDWEAHMKSVAHEGFTGQLWSCKVCLEDFADTDLLFQHLRARHGHEITNEVDAELLLNSRSYVKLDLHHLQNCFLCNEDMSRVKVFDHMAFCMEKFALDSLNSEPSTSQDLCIQIDGVDCAMAGRPLTPLETSGDTSQHLMPIKSEERASRRAISVPRSNTEVFDFNSASKRKSMDDTYDLDLTQTSRLEYTWAEARSGPTIRSHSTGSKRRPTKYQRLSRSAI